VIHSRFPVIIYPGKIFGLQEEMQREGLDLIVKRGVFTAASVKKLLNFSR